MDLKRLAEEIIAGRRLGRQDDLTFFLSCDLDELCRGADRLRAHFIGDRVDLCAILNGRSGRCPEDCKYCAQSAHNHTDCEVYDRAAINEFNKFFFESRTFFASGS